MFTHKSQAQRTPHGATQVAFKQIPHPHPPTQTHRTKPDITREDTGKLDQRLTQGQQTQTSPRSPEQLLPKSLFQCKPH